MDPLLNKKRKSTSSFSTITKTRKTARTTTKKKVVGDVKSLPVDAMIHTLSYLRHDPALVASKVMRPTHGEQLQESFKKSRVPHHKCMEAIYAKYPFLPPATKKQPYIHIYPTLFNNFQKDCIPNHFHNQIEQCCFRIDYHVPGILEYILDPSRVSFANKTQLLKVLEGIAETFTTKNEDDVIDFRHPQKDLKRMYQLLLTLLEKYDSMLTVADLHAMMEVLSSKRFMEWSQGAMYHINSKVELISKLVEKIPSLEKRMEFITAIKWKKFLEYKYGYISLLMRLMKWSPPNTTTIPRKWNAMMIELIMKPPVDKEYVRLLYDSYFEAIRTLCENGQWEQHADYYLHYFVGGFLPAPPSSVRHHEVENVLGCINPRTIQGALQWFRLFAAVNGRLSEAMKKTAILRVMKRIASNVPDSFPILVQIYQSTKRLDFLFHNPSQVLESVEKEMNKLVFNHQLLPGGLTKSAIKDRITKSLVGK